MHIRHRHLKPISKLGVTYFFLSLGISIATTIWSVYLNSFLHNTSLVGFLTSLFTVIEVIAYLGLIPLIEKTNKAKMLILSLVFFATSYFLLSVYSNIYVVIVLGIMIAIFSSLRTTLVGLVVRDNTKAEEVSKNEGVIYALLNSAWFVGPLLAGYIAANSPGGFKSVFFISAVFILVSIFVFRFFHLRDDRKNKEIDRHVFRVLVGFFKNKERTLTYILTMSVTFWWTFIFVYMPIYIVNKGMSEFWLGIFVAAVSVPLIFFDYFFGKVANKSGFKKLFFAGFISLGIIAIACFFVSNIYIICSLLVLASISVSMIEPTSEAYFMDIVEEEERDKYYSIYTTSVTSGALLASLPTAALLSFLPFNYLFLYFGIPMIILAFLALTIEDSYELQKAKSKLAALKKKERKNKN
jgi:MFS transporter, DHA1 family, multidrug resistance protein